MKFPFLLLLAKLERYFRAEGISVIEAVGCQDGCMLRVQFEGKKYSFFVLESKVGESLVINRIEEEVPAVSDQN